MATCQLACDNTPTVAPFDAGHQDVASDLTCGDGLKLHDARCVVGLPDCKDNEVSIPGGGCKRVGVETCTIDGVPGIKAPPDWTCKRVGVQECTTAAGGKGIKGPPAWTCLPIGTPTTCLAGWQKVSGGWCEPILPAKPCAKGTREVIGKSTCQPVGDCGSGPYGALTPTASTLYVDQASTAATADGSLAKPFKTIEAAIKVAPAGAQIAVAAGTYKGDLLIDKPLTLRGRCPKLVTLQGQSTANNTAALSIAANGVTLAGLTVTGPAIGVAIAKSTAATLEQAVVQASGSAGIAVVDNSQATLEDLLVDKSTGLGVAVRGSQVKLKGCTVRGTRVAPSYRGIGVYAGEGDSATSTLTIEKSALIDNEGGGLWISGSSAEVSRTAVVRNQQASLATLTDPPAAIHAVGTKSLAKLKVLDSVVADNRTGGIWAVAASAEIERCVVRDTLPALAGDNKGSGLGILATTSTAGASTLKVRDALIRGNSWANIVVPGSTATIQRTIIHSPAPATNGVGGNGIYANYYAVGNLGGHAVLTVEDSLVADSRSAGILVGYSEATVNRSVVRGTRAELSRGIWGNGIFAALTNQPTSYPRAVVTVNDCTITDNQMAGIWASDSKLTISGSLIEATKAGRGYASWVGPAANKFGYGVAATTVFNAAHGELSIKRSLTRDNQGQGITVKGVPATIERTVVHDTVAIEPNHQPGVGILATPSSTYLSVAPSLTIRESLVQRARYVGIAVYHGSATIEQTLVRDTQAQSFQGNALGVGIYAGPAPGALYWWGDTNLTLRESAVIDSKHTGVLLWSARARMERCVVSNTESVKGEWGDGVAAVNAQLFDPVYLEVQHSHIRDSARAGLFISGGSGAVRRSVFSGGQHSVVLEADASPTFGPHNLFTGNTDDRIASGSNITLPTIPSLPPAPM